MLADRIRMGRQKDNIYVATDDDFSGTTDGSFQYIGTEKVVKIPHVIKGVPVTSYMEMFLDASVEKVISDNPNVTNMDSMFYWSQSTTLDLSSFDTSNVTDMSAMFFGSSATALDLSSFDTSNVTSMSYMFHGSPATELDLSSFDTSKVRYMGSMFQNSAATILDLSSFDTSNVTSMSYMFDGSQATIGYARTQADADRFNASSGKPAGLNFIYLHLATDDDFSGTTDGSFQYIGTETTVKIPHIIKGIPVTSYYRMLETTNGKLVEKVVSDNPNITDMSYMFYNSQATSLDLFSFDTSNVTNMNQMFSNSKATSLGLSLFDTSNIINMSNMFAFSQATSLDLSSFDTSNVTDMSGMFYGSKTTSLDLSSFDTSNVTNMGYMFEWSQATTLDLSSFDTSNVTSMGFMFSSSKATIGYARTQADADRFNASSNKPSALVFVVKNDMKTYDILFAHSYQRVLIYNSEGEEVYTQYDSISIEVTNKFKFKNEYSAWDFRIQLNNGSYIDYHSDFIYPGSDWGSSSTVFTFDLEGLAQHLSMEVEEITKIDFQVKLD